MNHAPHSIFSDIATPVHINGGFFAAGGTNQHIHNAKGPVVQWNVSGGQNRFPGNGLRITPPRSTTSDTNVGQSSTVAQATAPAATVAQRAQNGTVRGGTVTKMGTYGMSTIQRFDAATQTELGRTRSAVTRTFG
ncbi:hypothetical protein BKA70DRAFT_1223661 [Coprinopsis sp. MPI-PUGE-AT-0042]|nr:hypothetical protein BKA70DRAFT_1223661 [Coprinopsis sp. MPI-PUGE-AT-0042]